MDEMNNPQTEGVAPARGALHRGKGVRWAIGAAAVAVLTGASVLGVTMSNSANGAAHAASATLTGSGAHGTGGNQGAAASNGAFGFASGGQASGAAKAGIPARAGRARLRACIASARHLRATGHKAAARARLHACLRRFLRRHGALRHARGRLARLAFLARHAEHGQVTVATKNGPKTIAFERGTVQSVSGASVVVKAADGVTWTWLVGRTTHVFLGGHRAGAPASGDKALADGQRIAVAGLVSDGTNQARWVLIRPPS